MPRSYDPARFLAGTYLFSWAIWLGLLGAAHAGAISTDSLGSLYAIGGMGPSLVALVLVWRQEGGRGLAAFAKQALVWKVPIGWYAFALGLPFGLRLAAIGLHIATGGTWLAPEMSPLAVFGIFGFALVVPLMEEYGWRGYLQPALSLRRPALQAGLMVGIAWAVWHYPLFWFPGTGFARWANASGPVTAIAGYTASVLALALLFTWQFVRTSGNLFLAFLLHDAVNTSSDVLFAPYARQGIATPTWWFVLVMIAAGLVTAWALRRTPASAQPS